MQHTLRSRLPDLAAIVLLVTSSLLLHRHLDNQGMFFVMTPLNYFWQVLDPQWLSQDLAQSILYLHSQPPMLNFLIGVGLHQQAVSLDKFFHILFQVLSVGILLLLYGNFRLLKVPWGLSLTLSLIWMIYPAFIYYQHFLFYPLVVQFLLLLAVFTLGLGMPDSGFSLSLFFLAIALLFFTRSTFNLLFVSLVFLLFLLTRLKDWKRLVLLAAPGLILITAFTLKNVVFFNTLSTSSWLGMNLANVAITGVTLEERQRLVDEGKVSQLVLTGPFEDIAAYPEDIWKPASLDCQGPDALCQPKKNNQEPNMNYIGYIPVSNTLLRDDIAMFLNFPGSVLKQVGLGWRIYFSPALVTVYVNKRAIEPIRPWMDWTNKVLCGDIRDVYQSAPCYRLQVFYLGIVLSAAGAFYYRLKIGLVSFKERAMIVFSLLVLFYSLAVGILFDLGENNRFRLDTDPLMMILLGYCIYYSGRMFVDRFKNRFETS
jgi:hypothetical protein